MWLDEIVRLSHFSASKGILSGAAMRACNARLTSLVRAGPWCVLSQYNMRMDPPPWIIDRLNVTVEEAVATGVLRTIRLSEQLLWKGKTFLYTRSEELVYACLRAAVLSGYRGQALAG